MNNDKLIIQKEFIKLSKSQEPDYAVSEIRQTIATTLYGPIIDEIKKYPSLSAATISKVGNLSLSDIDRTVLMFPIDFEDEIKWAKAILSKNHVEINGFLTLSNQFSHFLLSGNYNEASDILTQVEKTYGQSFWLIKNKLAFLQLTEGLESQKKYSNTIKENCQKDGFVQFISHWVSVRNEGTVTPSRFFSDFLNLLNRHNLEQGYNEYLQYHVLGEESFATANALHILRMEFSKSLIDYYEAFVFLSRLITYSGTEFEKKHVSYSIKKLIATIKDERLDLLLSLNTDYKYTPFIPAESISAYEHFLQGKYTEGLRAALSGLEIYPAHSAIIGILALLKALTDSSDSVELSEIKRGNDQLKVPLNIYLPNLLSIILKKGIGYAISEVNELIKLSLNFSSQPWTSLINLYLRNEHAKNITSKKTELSVLKTPNIHPYFLTAINTNQNLAINYLQILDDTPVEGLSQIYVTARTKNIINIIDDLDEFSEVALLSLQANVAIKTKDYAQALSFGEKLVKSPYDYYKRHGQSLIANSLLNLDSINSSVDYVASVIIDDSYAYPLLPLEKMAFLLRPNSENWIKCKGLLSLSIVIDTYTKYIDKKYESERTYAFEDFLNNLELNRPSQLEKFADNFDKEQLKYFLKNICVEAIMDTSVFFDYAKDVVSERKEVCKLLIKLDPDNDEEYLQEIKDIVKQEVINGRMLEIDQSRIYIDIAKVREWAQKELKESFYRYTQYLKHGLDPENKANQEEAVSRAADMDVEGLLLMSVPKNEVNALFTYLIAEMTNAYSSNPEFGLERYLSTRIRHGVLESHLRRPLDKYHLLTQKEHEKGEYILNSYWLEQLSIKLPDIAEFNKALANFSLGYDNIITKINTEWLRVKKNDQLGLFNFNISAGEISLLASHINAETNFKEFQDILLNYLSERLAANLEIVRLNLENAKREAVELMNTLQVSVSEFWIKYSISELESSINLARTDIQAVFDRIAEWFSTSQSIMSTPYNIEDAISVAEAIVKQAFPDFTVSTNFLVEGTKVIIQGGLPTFIDILINIFENVVRRSGLSVPTAETIVDLQAPSGNNSSVEITTINSLHEEIDIEDLVLNLNKRKELLKGHYINSIIKEGGSGFFKIHRSLRDFRNSALDIEPSMDFGVINNRFFIKISLPMRLVSEEIITNPETI